MSEATISMMERNRIMTTLDREIAVAAGYRFVYALPQFPDESIVLDKNGQPFAPDASDYWHVFSPDGQYVTSRNGMAITDLWHGYDLARTYPAYSLSLDAVYAALPKHLQLRLNTLEETENHPKHRAQITAWAQHGGVAWFRNAGSDFSIQHAAARVLLDALLHVNELRAESDIPANWTP